MTDIMTVETRWLPPLFAKAAEAVARFASYLAGTDRIASEREFTELVRLHDDMIKRICFGYARTSEEFDDLHQDTLVNIWQGLPKFNGNSSVKTWVYRVALNTCVSSVRLRSRRIGAVPFYDVVDFTDESAERAVEIKELHESISRLEPVDKAIVMMWLDEYSYDEIADTIGIKRNTVATRLHRAKEKLRKII